MTQIWIDPDKPQALFDKHRLWSASRFAPIRFKRKDYFNKSTESITANVKCMVAEQLDNKDLGSVRMVTQPRMWGWLFNPLTIYFVWDVKDQLCAAVLEVTNTPWKERHFYCCALVYNNEKSLWEATFDKKLHVSPFLASNYRYDFTVKEQGNDVIVLLNVVPLNQDAKPILRTVLKIRRQEPTKQTLSKALRYNAFSTFKTSLGIHYQALRLWLKRVPFVAHTKNR